MKKTCLIILVLLLAAGSARAGELKQIELTDGSVITGEVLSLANGIYTIRTASLGTVTVRDDRVRTIRSRGSAAPAPHASAAPSPAEISSLTEKMMSDGEVMDMIQSLKDDPSFQKALEDPEIMNNATVRDIQRKMQK